LLECYECVRSLAPINRDIGTNATELCCLGQMWTRRGEPPTEERLKIMEPIESAAGG
jgi:hypothetical protein